MNLTIFTPTYNRAHTLPRLYQSLCLQTDSDFEWLVIDDGSTDDTENLLLQYKSEHKINIRYYKVTNGGKNRAVNKAVGLALGYLFMIVDSDDYLALETVVETIKEDIPFLKEHLNYCGIVGNKVYENFDIIGNSTTKEVLDTNFINYREKYKIAGDRAEVIKTLVMKEFPLPELKDEKFCPEGIIWNRMAQKYMVRFVNKPFVICEYLADGMTRNIVANRSANPSGFLLYYGEYCRLLNARYMNRIKRSICYWAVYSRSKNIELDKYVFTRFFWTYPLGKILSWLQIL